MITRQHSVGCVPPAFLVRGEVMVVCTPPRCRHPMDADPLEADPPGGRPPRCWSCDLWCMLGSQPPPREQTDRCQKHCLPTTSFAGSNNGTCNIIFFYKFVKNDAISASRLHDLWNCFSTRKAVGLKEGNVSFRREHFEQQKENTILHYSIRSLFCQRSFAQQFQRSLKVMFKRI